MLKKISIEDLDVGMYVHDLDCGWLKHPFLSNSFKINNEGVIRKIRDVGVRRLVIDTDKGKDVGGAEPERAEPEAAKRRPNANAENKGQKKFDLSTEMSNAQKILRDARSVVHNILASARADEAPQLDAAQDIVDRISDSLARNPNALVALGRMKQKDKYMFQHPVTCSILMGAFAHAIQIPADEVSDLILGGLLFDIGKVLVSPKVLLKQGNYSEEDYAAMCEHVNLGYKMLKEIPDIPKCVLNMTLHHHERHDGSGYPSNLKGNQISVEGRMAGIVDMYDALTAHRPHQSSVEPALALKKILETSDKQFEGQLVQQFIRAMGIYPIASLIRLDNGMVGVVLEQTEKLLRPISRFFYDFNKRRYVQAHTVDLSDINSRYASNKIVGTINAEEYQINPYDFI